MKRSFRHAWWTRAIVAVIACTAPLLPLSTYADSFSDAQGMLLGTSGQSNFVQMGNSLATGPVNYGTSGAANCDTTKGQVCANDALPSSYDASSLQQYTSSYGGNSNATKLQSQALQQQLNDKAAAAANQNSDSPAQWLYNSANTGAANRNLGTSLGSGAADNLQTMNAGSDPSSQPGLLSSLFSGCTATTNAAGGVDQSCSGAVKCLGNSCYNPQTESNSDFGSFAAASQMINAIHSGMVCAETGKPPSQANTCTPTQIQAIVGYQPDPLNPDCTSTDCMIPVMGPQDICQETGKAVQISCNGGAAENLVGTIADMPSTCQIAAVAPDLNAYPQKCTPTVFVGTNEQCSNYAGSGVGLSNDCCAMGANAAAGISLTALISLSDMIPQVKQLKAQLFSEAKSGLSPLTDAVSSLANDFESGISTLAGNLEGGLTSTLSSSAVGAGMGTEAVGTSVGTEANAASSLSSGGSIPGLDGSLTKMMTDAKTSVLGPEAAQQVLQAYDYFNTAMMYYSIASTIGMLATQCAPAELQVGVKKRNKLCVTMGTYCKVSAFGVCLQETTKSCCYSSVITRILAQQIKKQLFPGEGNNGFGADDNPSCGGFSPEQLAAVDWTKVDLSEWTDLMQQTGFGLPQTGDQVNAVASDPNSAAAYYMPGTGAATVDEQQNAVTRAQQLNTNNALEASRADATQNQATCYTDPSGIPVYTGTPVAASAVITSQGSPQSDYGFDQITDCTPTVAEHCIQLNLGRQADDYIHDTCTRIWTQVYNFFVGRPDLIVQAHLVDVAWDDHVNVQINGTDVFTSGDYYDNAYFVNGGVCDLKHSWRSLQPAVGIETTWNPPGVSTPGFIDLTALFQGGGSISTRTSLIVGGGGEGYATIQVEYNDAPNLTPTNCISPPSPQ